MVFKLPSFKVISYLRESDTRVSLIKKTRNKQGNLKITIPLIKIPVYQTSPKVKPSIRPLNHKYIEYNKKEGTRDGKLLLSPQRHCKSDIWHKNKL